MYLLTMCIRSICRNRIRSILLVGVCGAAILLLHIYQGNLSDNLQQLKDLPKIFSITAQVTNRNGSRDTGLEIDPQIVEKLKVSDYVKDLKLTMQLAGVLKEERKGVEAKEAEVSMRAINRGDALPGFSWKNVELTEGINSSFLEGNGAECLVTERFLKRNNLTEGERIRLLIRYPKLDDLGKVEWIDGGQEQFQIVGVIKDGEETGEWQELPDVVVPFGWAESTRDAWKADSASFILNLEDAEDINRFKEEMKEIPLHEIQPVGENNVEGNALVVRDESFLDSAARLKRQVRMLQWFRPVIAAVTLLAGYVAAWILAQSQQKEYWLMRLEGVKAGNCFLRFFLEHFFLALAGLGLAGIVLAGVGTQHQETTEVFWKSGGLFLLCYLSGTAAALLLSGRRSVMASACDWRTG